MKIVVIGDIVVPCELLVEAAKHLDSRAEVVAVEWPNASRQEFQHRAQNLEKNGPVMSDADRIKAQQNLVDMNREFQRKQREFSEDLIARRNEALASVLDKANKVVRDIAQKDHYDIIFQEAVYVNPRIDITDKVLKALDAQSGK